jgi:glycosyltransferase involved in cell wall biosynthesis
VFRERYGIEGPFVLYVGRVEPRKNVLGLVRALRPTGLGLVAIGDVVPGYEGYGEACRVEGAGITRWIGAVDHDGPVLPSAYRAARVFALASWFETPGLAALEAGLAGCPVVITPHGSTREVFGELAGYARPDRPREIREAVAAAWGVGRSEGLARHIARHYLWSEVARRTAEAYDRVAR